MQTGQDIRLPQVGPQTLRLTTRNLRTPDDPYIPFSQIKTDD